MTESYFRVDRHGGGEVLNPQSSAASSWAGGGTVRGMASSAVMARAAEQAVLAAGISGLRPARWTADLSRPVPMEPLRSFASILRRGRRLCLVDVELLAGQQVVARARALFARGGVPAAGQAWAPAHTLTHPPEGLLPRTRESRLYYSEGLGWTPDAAPHQNTSRKQIWLFPTAVVDTEPVSPFQSAAAVADLASVVTHWGDAGLAHINADLTLSLARLPAGAGLGVAGLERVESDGIAIGTTLVHDRDGVIGTSTVTALANGDRVVDPRLRDRAP